MLTALDSLPIHRTEQTVLNKLMLSEGNNKAVGANVEDYFL